MAFEGPHVVVALGDLRLPGQEDAESAQVRIVLEYDIASGQQHHSWLSDPVSMKGKQHNAQCNTTPSVWCSHNNVHPYIRTRSPAHRTAHSVQLRRMRLLHQAWGGAGCELLE